MQIFFDLDGTLIDSRPRLYKLFQHLVPESKLTFEEYWSLKRNKTNHAEILTNKLSYNKEQLNTFETKWMKLIEQEEWLKFDGPFVGIKDFLHSLKKKGAALYLVTARQSRVNAIQQLKRLGLEEFFNEILVTERLREKTDLISPYLNLDSNNWIVGDTGADVNVGKSLGINTAAVLTGFRNKDVLESYQPDVILQDVKSFNIKL